MTCSWSHKTSVAGQGVVANPAGPPGSSFLTHSMSRIRTDLWGSSLGSRAGLSSATPKAITPPAGWSSPQLCLLSPSAVVPQKGHQLLSSPSSIPKSDDHFLA